jgi:hypothetical protein
MATLFITGYSTIFKDTDGGSSTVRNCWPCQNSCPFAVTDSGTKMTDVAYLAYQGTFGGFCISATNYLFVWDAVGNIRNRFYFYADGVALYDSGCVTGSGSSSFTIPAGTKQVDIIVEGNCSNIAGSQDEWSISGNCF